MSNVGLFAAALPQNYCGFRHDKIVALVQTMLDLNKALQAAKTPTEQTALKRQIAHTDNQIDHLTYELYNLTPEEIKIIEDATAPK
jgi:adenine-specific DNA-methyltransferase